MKARRMVGVLALAVFAAASGVFGATLLDVPPLNNTPKIDGLVVPQETTSATVTTMTLFGGFMKPDNSTSVTLAITPGGLYLGFVCSDKKPSELVTNVKKENGPVFRDDSVEIVITPAKTPGKSNYYHFALNAAGVPYSNDPSGDRAVDGWKYSAQKTSGGWEAEVLIPMSSIGAWTGAAYLRANFARHRPARGSERAENCAWVNPGTTIHNYTRFGYLKLGALPSSVTGFGPAITSSETTATTAALPSKTGPGTTASTVTGFSAEAPASAAKPGSVPGFSASPASALGAAATTATAAGTTTTAKPGK